MSPTRDALESFRRASLPRQTTLLPKSSFRNKERLCVALCKGIRIPKSGRFLLVELRILKSFARGIRNPCPGCSKVG